MARTSSPRQPPRAPSIAGEACALALSGLDPSGGAGLAADLRAFAAAGAWGCGVVTVVTVQSTAGLRSVHPIDAKLVLSQAREVLAHQRVRAMKTGALGTAENVRAVLALSRKHPTIPLVVDPVMIATRSRAKSGARLLDEAALRAMRALVSFATLVTPNADEAGALLGYPVRDLADQERAAKALVSAGARAALVKGGHVDGDFAIDVLATERGVTVLRSPRVLGRTTHGGGCTLASLIAGKLAMSSGDLDDAIVSATRWAKRRITRAIANAREVGDGLSVLDV